jgi:isopenicillin-N N-acyltransferase-like protein
VTQNGTQTEAQTETPTIRVVGAARERGRQYGEQARERVRRSVALYEEVFGDYAGWSWERVRAECAPFGPRIADFDSRCLEEIGGIAEGAGLPEIDVLAINVRTEVMFGAAARGDARPPRDGCSAVVLMPQITADGHTLLAQNWDWIEGTRQTAVIVEARPDDGPACIAIMEAGLLAKMGLSAAGIGLTTNTIISDLDRGEPGVPYHVCLRSVLAAPTMADALGGLLRGRRSSSANYLVASHDGLAFDAETWPGDGACMTVGVPAAGRILHTNHFIAPGFAHRDRGLELMPDSPLRLQRLQALLGEPPADAPSGAGRPAGRAADGDRAGLGRADIEAALGDHAGHPWGVCNHPDGTQVPVHQEGTILSVVMDLTERRLWLADGNPCRTAYRELDTSLLRV